MPIAIVCAGRLRESYWRDAAAEYQKRMTRYNRLEIIEVPDQPETEGVMIAYATIYGHTREAAEKLAQKLTDRGCPKVVLADLARADWAECVEDAFRYSKLVLASV